MGASEVAQDIRQSLSAELLGCLTATFGVTAPIDAPTDDAGALLAIAQANVNFNNNILIPLSGLPVVELILKNAQLNEAVIGILLSSIETAAATENGRIRMVMPQDGGVYYGAVTEVTCTVEAATAVLAEADGEVFELSNTSGDTWSSLWAFPLGEHSLSVTAEFETGETADKAVSFSVSFWDTSLNDGDQIAAGSIEATLDPGEDTLESVTLSGLAAGTVELILDTASGLWKATLDAAAGTTTAVYSAMKDGVEYIQELEIIVLTGD